jgi:lysophospholipase L1-like esterase
VVVLALLAFMWAQALTRSEPSSRASAAERPSTAATEVPLVTFIGDSWTFGQGATGERGYAPLTAEALGWDYELLGVRGTGYLIPIQPYRDRIRSAVATDPDIVVVQGSLNDRQSDPTLLPSAVLDTLRLLRAGLDPSVEILVLGASRTPGTADDTIAAINAAVGGAADQLGLPFVDPAVGNWPDPADPAEWADPDHPNDLGHRAIAEQLAPILRTTLRR